MNPVNILTLKWGTLYSSEYVNRIYRDVKAYLRRPFRFVCVTDDASGLLPEIDAEPILQRPPEMKNLYTYEKNGWPNIYIKLLVFKPDFANLGGPTLFLDIDQIITGGQDCFFDYRPGEFCLGKGTLGEVKISVVIPVYDVERYLARRLDSVLAAAEGRDYPELAPALTLKARLRLWRMR